MPQPQTQQKGFLDQIWEFLAGRQALEKASKTGTPATPQTTPAQDNTYLKNAVAESMKTKKNRDMSLTPEGAKALAKPPKTKVR